MFNNWSYKKKYKFLILIAVLSIFICYFLSFSKTLSEYSRYKEHNGVVSESAESLDEKLIESKDNYIDKMLSPYLLDTINTSRDFLSFVSDYCQSNNISLKEYKPNKIINLHPVQILTRSIIVEGAFSDCLELVFQIEKKNFFGHLSSVRFTSNKDPSNNTLRLNCTIYLQNIISY